MSGLVELIPPWCNWQHCGFWCHLSGFESWRGGHPLFGPRQHWQGPPSCAPGNAPVSCGCPPTPSTAEGHPVSAIRPAAVVVLAAGEGTRMKSATPKVLHEICGRSLVGHVLAAARELDPENLVVVVGHAREKVGAHLAGTDADVRTAVQAQQNGTGHAVRMALEELGGRVDGTVD